MTQSLHKTVEFDCVFNAELFTNLCNGNLNDFLYLMFVTKEHELHLIFSNFNIKILAHTYSYAYILNPKTYFTLYVLQLNMRIEESKLHKVM